MEENKNIDRLFQEKFKDFEVNPSHRVWNKIAAQQKKKSSKKVIPLWWKLGGIAAALVVIFSLSRMLLPSEVFDTSPLVDQQSYDDDENSFLDTPEVEKIALEKSESPDLGKTLEMLNNSSPKNHAARSTTTREQTASNTNAVVSPSKNRALRSGTPNSSIKKIDPNTTAAASTAIDKSSSDLPLNASFKEEIRTFDVLESSKEVIASSLVKDSKKDLRVEAKKIKEKQDTEALAQNESRLRTSKWNVGAVAAPVYYGDFGGSGLDKQFADNDKSGDLNISYGINVSYAVSPKVKVRTGVNSLDLSYTTNEISYSTSGQGRSLRSVNYADDVATLVITDNSGGSGFMESFVPQRVGITSSGALEQRLSYLEIPMEAIYTLSEKRVGFSVIGGISTLVLNDNRVILSSQDLTTNLGSSKNVNDLSFSTNIGLGLDYKMTDKLQFNLEPSFKYQLNAFDENVVDFKPYYLGVYTGVSYKF